MLSHNSDVDFGDGALTFAIEEDGSGPDVGVEYLTSESDVKTVHMNYWADRCVIMPRVTREGGIKQL